MPARPADTRWDARIARARRLARERPAASEALSFYANLATLQRTLPERHSDPLAALPDLLGWLQREAPAPLAHAARELSHESPERCQDLIDRVARGFSRARAELPPSRAAARFGEPRRSFSGGGKLGATTGDTVRTVDDSRTFIGEALLQAFADEHCAHGDRVPVVATLREEGHGARRSYVCGLCIAEWPAPRIGCAACGEERFDALPVFRAGETDPARVDACDTCRVYLKTIDLTRDGAACPIVDDLATLSLDLWAREQGYRRLRPNLLRL